MFACSGSPDSSRYREATKFRAMCEMGWEEARIALNRLVEPGTPRENEPVCRSRGIRPHCDRLYRLCRPAGRACGKTARRAWRCEGDPARPPERPASRSGEQRRAALPSDNAARRRRHAARPESFANAIVRAFWTLAPTPAGEWVRVVEATADQAVAALDYLRATMATWDARRPVSASVLDRLLEGTRRQRRSTPRPSTSPICSSSPARSW